MTPCSNSIQIASIRARFGAEPTQQRSSRMKEKKMSEIGTRDIPLSWDVIVAPGIPIVSDDLPPGIKIRMFSPVSSTLISGERDAVLVDALLTVEQAVALVDWIATSGKNLTTIYRNPRPRPPFLRRQS